MRIERDVAFWIAALLVFVGLLWLLRPVVLPFILGAALAYLLDPLAKRLTKRGLSRLIAALVILAGFALAFAVLFLLLEPPLADQLLTFVERLPLYLQRLQSLIADPNHPWLGSILGSRSGADGGSSGLLSSKLLGYLPEALATLLTKGEALISVLSVLVVTPVVAFYLLCDWHRVVDAFDGLIPLRRRATVRSIFREINAAVLGYLHGQLTVCLILGCYYAGGLTLAGLRYGILIGVVAGLLTFIPYVGSLTALVISSGVALAEFLPDWRRILVVVVVVLVGQFLEGNVLSPKLVGSSVGLHPVWLIFALLACGYLFGFVGLVLAVPVAAAVGVLTRFALRHYRASPLFTGEGRS